MVAKNCERCEKEMQVRQADLNRGWGKFCSKSCKAKQQMKRRFYVPKDSRLHDDLEDVGHPLADGYFGHGQN